MYHEPSDLFLCTLLQSHYKRTHTWTAIAPPWRWQASDKRRPRSECRVHGSNSKPTWLCCIVASKSEDLYWETAAFAYLSAVFVRTPSFPLRKKKEFIAVTTRSWLLPKVLLSKLKPIEIDSASAMYEKPVYSDTTTSWHNQEAGLRLMSSHVTIFLLWWHNKCY